MMKCAQCGAELNKDAVFCKYCGVRINVCPKCGYNNHSEAKFCRNCGRDLSQAIPATFKVPTSATPQPNSPDNPGNKKRSFGLILLTIAIILIIGMLLGTVCFLGVRHFLRDKSGEESVLQTDSEMERPMPSAEEGELDSTQAPSEGTTDEPDMDSSSEGEENSEEPDYASSTEESRVDRSCIIDSIGLLTEREYTVLNRYALETSEQYKCGVYLYIVEDWRQFTSTDVLEAAKTIYTNDGLGYGVDQSGILLLLCISNREYALIAHGFGNTAVTDYGKEKMTEQFQSLFENDNWYGCISCYLETSEKYLILAQSGAPFDVGTETVPDATSDHPETPPPEAGQTATVSMSDVDTVTASSALNEFEMTHSPSLVMDGDTTTGWVEGAEGQGEGEMITFTLSAQRQISGFSIYNGYQKSDDLYHKNSRPSRITVFTPGGESYSFDLEDSMGMQTFRFSEPLTSSSISFRIDSVYAGSKYKDTVISEIALF